MHRLATAAWLGVCVFGQAFAAAPAERIFVLVRHGEKPEAGLGQLDCQGLNRALALPAVIARDFGRPAAIYAPNPSVPKTDSGVAYDYIRPLATIEPTAIAFGLPVDVSFGLADTQALAKALLAPAQAPGIVLIAWEHVGLVALARQIVASSGGDPAVVPDWDRQDFDGIDVLHVSPGAGAPVRFEHRQEGLNGMAADCPGLTPK